MTDTKSKGGRGIKAENKYDRLTVTLPPELKTKLDNLATATGLNRSEMLAKVIQDHGSTKGEDKRVIPVISVLPQEQKFGVVEVDKAPIPFPDSASGEELTGLTILQVTSSVIPQNLKNRLRWSPERYTELERVLRGTKSVSLDVNNGKSVWRDENNAPMRKDTVKRLLAAGVLKPV